MPSNEETVVLRLQAANEADAALNQVKQRVDGLKQSYEQAADKANKLAAANNKQWVDASRDARQHFDALQKSYRGLDAAQAKATQAHNAYGQALAKLGKDGAGHLRGIGDELAHHVTRFVSVGAAIEGVRRGFERFAESSRGFERVRMETSATAEQITELEHSFETLSAVTGQSMEELTRSFRKFAAVSNMGFEETKKLFSDVALAAHVTEGSVVSLGTAAAAAMTNLKLSQGDMREVLDTWAKTIPATMMDVFAEAAPKIMSSLRAMNIQGKETAEQVGSAFAGMAQKMGGGAAGSVMDSLITKAKDYKTILGKMVLPGIDASGARDYDTVMKSIIGVMDSHGLLDPSTSLVQKSVMMDRFGFTDKQIEGAIAYKEQLELIDKVAKETGRSASEVRKRLTEMDKGPKQTLDALYAQFDKILTKLGGMLMLTGMPNNLLKTLETTSGELTKIMKIMEWLEKHTPEWLGGKPADKPGGEGEGGGKGKEDKGDLLGRFTSSVTRFSPLRIPQAILGEDWLSKYFKEQGEGGHKKQEQDDIDASLRKHKPKMALGGEFRVPGSGSSDTEPVEFMGTPGERVTVEPKAADTKESLQLQQDKADIALREHFARFHSSDRARKGADVGKMLKPDDRSGGSGLFDKSGRWTGGRGGDPAADPRTGTRPGGGGRDGTPGGTGGADTGLKTPVGTDPNSPTGPAETLEEAYKRGYLKPPGGEGGGAAAGVGAIPKTADADTVAALNEVSKRYGLDPQAIAGVIKTESAWDTKNTTGSYRGLTQISATTFKEAGGKLGGMTYDQFVNASPGNQIRAYGDWLQHYKFSEKAKGAGVDLGKMSPAQQAAYLQGFQFAPNATGWQKAAGQGQLNVPTTGSKQAGVLGNKSLAAMTQYYSSILPGARTPGDGPGGAPQTTTVGGLKEYLEGGASGGSAALDDALKMEGKHEYTDRQAIKAYLGGWDPVGRSNAWCARFVNSALGHTGGTGTGSEVATDFLNWGKGVDGAPQAGDVMIQANGRKAGETGGHVGFATGRVKKIDGVLHYEMYSGNASDQAKRDWRPATAVTVRRGTEKELGKLPIPDTKVAGPAAVSDIETRAKSRYDAAVDRAKTGIDTSRDRGDDDGDVGAHPLGPKPTVLGDTGAHPLTKPPAAATDAGGAKWIRHPTGDWENVGKRPGTKPAAVATPKPAAAPAPAPAPDPAPADDDTGELASGGIAQQGRSYRVGERGPELFTPRETGEVSTAGKTNANPTPAVLAKARQLALSGDLRKVSEFMKTQGYPRTDAWCGKYMASVYTSQGLKPPKNFEAASAWRHTPGHEQVDSPMEGDLAVKTHHRTTGKPVKTDDPGSHITQVDSVDGEGFGGLGGNQGGGQGQLKVSQFKTKDYEYFRRIPESERGKSNPVRRGDIDTAREAAGIRTEMARPIEPVIKPRMQMLGPPSLRWSRHTARQQQNDASRMAARASHTDGGFQ